MEKIKLGWSATDDQIHAGTVVGETETQWKVRWVGTMEESDLVQFMCNYMNGKGIDELCHNGMKIKFEK